MNGVPRDRVSVFHFENFRRTGRAFAGSPRARAPLPRAFPRYHGGTEKSQEGS